VVWKFKNIAFTARRYASAVYASCHSVFVHLSVTCRYCTKTAKYTITQTTPYDRSGTSFLTPKISAKFQGGNPNGGAKQRCGRLQSAIFDQYFAVSQKRRKMGT